LFRFMVTVAYLNLHDGLHPVSLTRT
jgi:hypothetical protein